jgi:hypothetical protein
MIAWDVNRTLERLPFYCEECPAWHGFNRALLAIGESLRVLKLTDDELMSWATRYTVNFYREEFGAAQVKVSLN